MTAKPRPDRRSPFDTPRDYRADCASVILGVVKDDPDDNKVLECAQSANSECIVSGDKDLLRLRFYDAIPALTMAEFLKQFELGTAPAPVEGERMLGH